MAEFFLSLSGKLANQVIDIYLGHQTVFNTLVVLYGILLALANYNLQRIQYLLLKQYNTKEYAIVLDRLARENDDSIIGCIREKMKFPLIASPFFFAIYRISRRNLIFAIGKKEKVSRKWLGELLLLEQSNTPQIKE
ncbi:MAG: hypothetical protein PWQ29_1610 [Verrucomicrobiota bacterium]|jgi:hypothetical protein|nr:hypothetical protein [Verrucomicrobiota bacterium]MDK2964216.1 hypothetical protein [Verrucomicrobiota bacterium]